MARGVLKADWAPTLRASIAEAGVPRGWSVTRSGSYARLRVRTGAGGKTCWTKNLKVPWAINNIGAITEMVVDLHQRTTHGLSLDEAWAQLSPAEHDDVSLPGHVSLIGGVNWDALVQNYYRDRERNGTRIGERTMLEERRYLGAALAVLGTKNPPTTAYKLIDAALEQGNWSDAPRSRQCAVRAICRFLQYAIDHEGLSPEWELPPRQKAKLAGDGRCDDALPVAPLTDSQIIELIDSVQTPAWQNALLLMATYGLRPAELLHLSVEVNPDTGMEQLYCSYRKACGGRTTKLETEPRFLHPCPLRDAKGRDRNGDLTAAWKAGLLPLPPMADKGKAVSQYLYRQPLWKRWTAEFAAQGKRLRPYSLRNSYSIRCHARGINTAAVSLAMGHSERTHSASYLVTTGKVASEAFASALRR